MHACLMRRRRGLLVPFIFSFFIKGPLLFFSFNVPDADVIKFLKVLTFLDLEEIDRLEGDMKRPGYVPNTAQSRLAEEVTRFVHGDGGLQEALRATEALRPGAQTKLDWKAIEGIAEDFAVVFFALRPSVECFCCRPMCCIRLAGEQISRSSTVKARGPLSQQLQSGY